MSIAQIIDCSYSSVLSVMRKDQDWIDPLLNTAQKGRRIIIQSLSPTDTIQEVTIPVVWFFNDEIVQDTVDKQVNFVAALLRNALQTHDTLLLRKISGKHVAISKEYRYEKCPIIEMPDEKCYTFRIYTAFTVLDKVV